MKRKVLVYSVVLVTLINISALATMLYLRRGEKKDTCCPGRGFERIKKEVGLTEEQIRRFEENRGKFHAELDSLARLLEVERFRLANEVRRQEPDSFVIRETIEEIGRLQKQSQHLAIDHFLRIKKILTPEQREAFFDIALECFVAGNRFPGSYHNTRERRKDGRR